MPSKPRVLIVEDDAAFASALAGFVAAEGFDVRVEPDGLQGLGTLCEPPAPVLVLLDLLVSGIDGWHFYAEMRSNPHVPKVPVVVVSGAPKLEGMPPLDGILEYIDKPRDGGLNGLFTQVRAHLQRVKTLTGQAGGDVGANR